MKEKEELIELKADEVALNQFKTTGLAEFWIAAGDYLLLRNIAIKKLIPFASTYLCETAFSSLNCLKTKHRSRIDNIEPEMRLAVSNIRPEMMTLVGNVQAQGSH